MEIKNTPSDMSPLQKRALELYCESATMFTDYKPFTFAKLVEALEKEGLKASSSSLQRWSKKYNFDEYLKFQIQAVMIADQENPINEKALTVSVEKNLVDIKRNNELTADCYELMELFAKQVADNFDKHQVIKRDDIKIIKDIAVFTGGREDKLLDRIAEKGTEKLSSEEMMKEFDAIDVDIEVDDDEA